MISKTGPDAVRTITSLFLGTVRDAIGRHEVLLPINHQNYNFGEKKNSQVMEEKENLH